MALVLFCVAVFFGLVSDLARLVFKSLGMKMALEVMDGF